MSSWPKIDICISCFAFLTCVGLGSIEPKWNYFFMYIMFSWLCAQISYLLAISQCAILTGGSSFAPRKRDRRRHNSQSGSSGSDSARAAANRKKGKEARSVDNYKDCDPTVYALIRQKNWYLQPREDLDDQPWYNLEQACIYKDIYTTIKHPMRPMSAIDLNKLEKKK